MTKPTDKSTSHKHKSGQSMRCPKVKLAPGAYDKEEEDKGFATVIMTLQSPFPKALRLLRKIARRDLRSF